MANGAFEPAGSCTVQAIDPSWRESAITSPVNVAVNTGSLETVAPPSGICGSAVVHNCFPVARSMATIAPAAFVKSGVPTRDVADVYVVGTCGHQREYYHYYTWAEWLSA
jgi:hypothetical protein